MPWTKTKYPVSMKNLPAAIRNKAIEIANAIIAGKKKAEEDKIIATAIRKAKEMAAKAKKKATKSPAKKKTKTVAKAKVKSPAKKETKAAAPKKAKRIKTVKAKTKASVPTPVVTEKITHGDDLHLIPVHGEIHETGTAEIRHLENTFHHKEEVAFHQENRRMKEAMSSRKNIKRMNPGNRGRR